MRNSKNVMPMVGMVVKWGNETKTIISIGVDGIQFNNNSWCTYGYFVQGKYDIIDESNCWKEPTQDERIELFAVAAEFRKADHVNEPSELLNYVYESTPAVRNCIGDNGYCLLCHPVLAPELYARIAESLAMDGM